MHSLLISALLVAGTVSAFAQSQPPLPENSGSFEYKSVAEAMDAVKAKPGATVSITKPDGWVIVSESDGRTVWSFTPAGHYAYPAVVRRAVVVRSNGDVHVEMSALCEAQKEPCDRLMREFQELNERMRESVQQRLKQRQ